MCWRKRCNGVARIFFGGATRYIFVTSLREPTAFSGGGGGGGVGGGVVAEIFRDLNYRIGFSEGG